MALPALIPILLNLGAPIIAGILKDRFGRGGETAGAVLTTLAMELGTDPTPEAITDAYEADPAGFTEKALKVEANYSEIARAAAEATMSYHRVLAGDQKAADALTRLWRPFNGAAFGVCVIMVVVTVCFVIIRQIPVDESAYPLVALVVPSLTVMAGVVGYYVRQRTLEKTAGVS